MRTISTDYWFHDDFFFKKNLIHSWLRRFPVNSRLQTLGQGKMNSILINSSLVQCRWRWRCNTKVTASMVFLHMEARAAEIKIWMAKPLTQAYMTGRPHLPCRKLQKHQSTWLAAQHFLLFIDYQSGSVIPAISRNAMYAVDLIQRFMVEPLIRCSPLQPKKLNPPLRLV